MRSSIWGGPIPECLPHELSCKIPNRPGECVIPRTDPIRPAGTFSRTQRSDSGRGRISIVVILSCRFSPSSSELDHNGRPWSVREWIVEGFSHDPTIREAAHSDRPDHPDARSSHHGRLLGAVASAGCVSREAY